MTTSPTEKTDRRSMMMATISVPSSEPPARMIRPTPRPSMMPPKIAARNGSSVTFGIGANTADQTDRMQMAIVVAIAKFLPICL